MNATYRRTSKGQWVVFAPVAMLRTGGQVTVTKRDGTTKVETIATVGRPFTADAVVMAYGYPGPAAPVKSAPSNGLACAECGRPGAIFDTTDMSGLAGSVCRRCFSERDSLSFA